MTKKEDLCSLFIKKYDKNLKKVFLPPDVWKLSRSLEDLNEAINVRQKFECPVCYIVKYPVSHTCPYGHVICYACYNTLRTVTNTRICPLCRSTPVKISVQAKILSNTFKFTNVSCRFRDAGCWILVRLANLGQHEAHCIYKPVFCIYPGCQWTDPVLSKLQEHVFKKHPEICFKTSASFFKF